MKETLARPADDLEWVMDTYGNMLFRLCLVMLGNSADAEDALQETMLKYYRKAPDFIDEEHRKAWLLTVAAAVALCLGLGGVTVMAGNGKLEGFFADVTRWDGTVVGMTYEQATEEIEVSATVSGDSIVVDAVFLKAGEAPYAFLDSVGVQAYSIVNAEGKTLVEGTSNEKAGITDDIVSCKLPLDELESGNYKLIITEFVGSAKADQDLPIKGYWVCEFSL